MGGDGSWEFLFRGSWSGLVRHMEGTIAPLTGSGWFRDSRNHFVNSCTKGGHLGL